MRPIKFRGWDENYHCWIKDFRIGMSGEIDTFDIHHGKVIIQQFTGLKDKNGKEIYEGDIIKIFDSVYIVKFGKHNVEWHSGSHDGDIPTIGFYLENESRLVESVDNFVEHQYMTTNQNEIIGNIYENPELIK